MSNETKWTPRPWNVNDGYICDAKGDLIKMPSGWKDDAWIDDNADEESAANARLIAAAPDLYAALVEAREFVRIFTPREDHLGDKAKDVANAIDAAMDKARGEQ